MAVPVYFADLKARSPKRNTGAKVALLLEKVLANDAIKKGDLTAIKIHFGEPGNDSFISPLFARKAADATRAIGAKPFFTDTNTLYRGGRSNAVDHVSAAIEHGFVPEVAGAPVLIADGLRSADWREVPLEGTWFKKAKIASGILDADSMIVLSHVKGHEMAGFGGAIKNLAMGCAPAAGKRDQHSVRFAVRQDTCVACGRCLSVCPVDAISQLESNKAIIDKARCIGCGECVAYCSPRAITMDWNVEIVEFTQKMTEYALAAIHGKRDRVVFLNFVTNVVPDCDCVPWSDRPIVPDLGILASTDPLAIDAASVDLIKAADVLPGSALAGTAGAGVEKFSALHPKTRGDVQLSHGASIGLGSTDYELIHV